MAPNYRDRRYRVVDGRLQKQFEVPPPDGWYVTKDEAWRAWNAAEAAAHASGILAAKAVNVGYQKRRYRVVDGKLAKKWDADPTWHLTKDEAWAAWNAKIAEQQARQVAKEPVKAAPPETPPANGGEPTTAATPEGESPEPETPEAEDGATSAPEPEPAPADPAAVPKGLRLADVMQITNLSRTSIFRKIRDGKFPSPLDTGKGGPLIWLETQRSALEHERASAGQAPASEPV